MTDDPDQPLGSAVRPDSESHRSAVPVADSLFNGAWFRRERERIAVGRRAIAKHLQVAESRVVALEIKDQQVPGPWLPLLAAFGFRMLPPLPTSAAESVAVAAPVAVVSTIEDPPADLAAPPATPAAAAVAAAVADAPVSAEPSEPRPLRANRSPKAASKPQPNPRIINGAWLQAERERLGLSRNTVRLLLNIHWATCARVEEQNLPVPRRYLRKLRELGFAFTPPDEPAPPAPPVESVPPTPLRGAWLRRERKRRGLGEREVWQALKIHWRTLAMVERRNRALPKEWLPTLQRLGLVPAGLAQSVAATLEATADSTAPQAVVPPETPAAAAPVSPAIVAPTADAGAAAVAQAAAPELPPPVPAQAAPAAAPEPSSPTQSADSAQELLAMIVDYRLTLGHRRSQSAVEILGHIIHDLRTSDLNQAFTHDQLMQALERLFPLRTGGPERRR